MGTVLYPVASPPEWVAEAREMADKLGKSARAADLAAGAISADMLAGAIVLVPELEGLDDIALLVDNGCRTLVESRSPKTLPVIWPDLESGLSRPGRLMTMILATGTAYRAHMAMHVVNGLRQCLPLEDEKAGDIELSLHEILANNIIHGNLELSSKLREEAESFADYIELLEERLGDTEMAARPVLVNVLTVDGGIRIFTRDNGKGFDPEQVKPIKWKQASGRGIDIARALSQKIEYSMGGCQVALDYHNIDFAGDEA